MRQCRVQRNSLPCLIPFFLVRKHTHITLSQNSLSTNITTRMRTNSGTTPDHPRGKSDPRPSSRNAFPHAGINNIHPRARQRNSRHNPRPATTLHPGPSKLAQIRSAVGARAGQAAGQRGVWGRLGFRVCAWRVGVVVWVWDGEEGGAHPG